MNWISLIAPLLKLAVALADWLRRRELTALGRAASDGDHARAAAEHDARMREIAGKPPARSEVEKRLEQGNA